MRRVTVCGASALCALGVLSACSGPRSGVSFRSSVDVCAATLPYARMAVHGHGTLLHVRAIEKDDLQRIAEHFRFATVLDAPPPSASASPITDPTPKRKPRTACLVTFRGPFDASGVQSPRGEQSGRYAVAVVTVHKPMVVAVIVTDQDRAPAASGTP